MLTKFLSENLERRDQFADINGEKRSIIKMVLKEIRM
jgi:hypothetical protein